MIRDGAESIFDFKKVDRAKLYGKRKRVVLDEAGESCVKAELSEDGSSIIRSGMTMQAYFDPEGEWVESSRMVGLDEEGKPVEKVPSTLGVGQELEEVEPGALSQNQTIAVYHLSPVDFDEGLKKKLDAGSIFRFLINYRADYSAEIGFLLSNDAGIFVLATKSATPEWCELKSVAVESFTDDSEVDDDLDFEMF
ncbi:MAG: hypothetical protein GY811_06265 [Myxococcales bacterium]|nr:hypothetical protein [Myxococcales bacterium]